MTLTVSLLASILLDFLFGEPRYWHPLRGFGLVADGLEARVNRGGSLAGALAVIVLTLLPASLAGVVMVCLPNWLGWPVAALVAAFCVGRRSLAEHARMVAAPLEHGDLDEARRRVARLVSRGTDGMDAPAVRRAAIESLLENAADAVFASIFWFALGGLLAGPAAAAALVVWHRLANTLDAMWGYRTARFAGFGWAAARLDDVLNWLPARITVLAFAVAGDARNAWRCYRQQSGDYVSPNAGAVMSAGAGAMGVRLGGGAYYHGAWEDRPWLGCGAAPVDGDIERGLGLVARALVVFCIVVAGMDWLV